MTELSILDRNKLDSVRADFEQGILPPSLTILLFKLLPETKKKKYLQLVNPHPFCQLSLPRAELTMNHKIRYLVRKCFF